MKKTPIILFVAAVAAFGPAGPHALHGHEESEPGKTAGPNGGRMLTKVDPHLEFFVTEDRKVKITAVDANGTAVPVETQSVTLIGGDRLNPTRMNFVREGDVLVSDRPLPEGNGFPVVVRIQASPDAGTVMEKFNLNMSACPTCEYDEYACVCGHGDE